MPMICMFTYSHWVRRLHSKSHTHTHTTCGAELSFHRRRCRANQLRC